MSPYLAFAYALLILLGLTALCTLLLVLGYFLGEFLRAINALALAVGVAP